MSSPVSQPGTRMIDHVLRHTLRRSVERYQPGADVRQTLLSKAAQRRPWVDRWPEMFGETQPERTGHSGLTPWELGWRELAFAQIVRPAGMVGSLACQLR